ncbi:acyltransferase domain-containing protein, partial [Streptomyces sp. NPDC054786]
MSHAFHSPLMEPMLAEFERVAASLTYNQPQVSFVSTLTGAPVTTELTAPGYWVRHVREAVRFADAVRVLETEGVTRFLEVGPDAVLTSMAQESVESESDVLAPTSRHSRPEPDALLTAVARLHVSGVTVDWEALFVGRGARPVPLPTYAFQRQRYWLDTLDYLAESWIATELGSVGSAGLAVTGHPLLGAAVSLADSDGVVLTGRLSLATHGWLADHAVGGAVLFPGAGFVELALCAGDEVGCDVLEELTLEAPLVLPEQGSVRIQVTVGMRDESGTCSLGIYSRADDEGAPWVRHAAGVLSTGAVSPSFDLVQWPPVGAEPVALDGLYEGLAGAGLEYG